MSLTKPKTLLSVDWDFFFPNPLDGARMKNENLLLWDWNKRESPFHIESIWTSRAAGFLANNLPLPSLHSSNSYTTFARRFKFAPHTKLYLAESHAQAARREVCTGIRRVMSFDAHHDCGYGSGIKSALRGEIHCDNWTIPYYMHGASIEVHYPSWRKRNEPGSSEIPFTLIRPGRRNFHDTRDTIDRVFICRSGAWVPPWHDDAFNEFVSSFALPVIDVGTYPREWSLADTEEHAARLVEQHEQLRQLKNQFNTHV